MKLIVDSSRPGETRGIKVKKGVKILQHFRIFVKIEKRAMIEKFSRGCFDAVLFKVYDKGGPWKIKLLFI